MKRKIAVIDPLGAHGASFHYYTFGQCKGLLNSNTQVSLYSNSETPKPDYSGLLFFTFYRNIFSSKYKIVSGLRWFIGSVKSILHAKVNGVSIFHFHFFHSNLLILFDCLLVKLLFGKLVVTIHDVESFSEAKDSSFISTIIYSLIDLILTHNEFSKKEIIKVYKFKKNDIHIIPHGNYTPFINIQNDKANSRKILKLPIHKNILLFFGMIKKVKGLEVLLYAFKEVIDKNPNTVLLIAGKPWENNFTKYQQIIDKNNLNGSVFLHTKFIPHKDVEYYFSASDLVVLPYKKIYQSGVLMMALSYARPVLVSDLPALKEVVMDNKNGFLFKSGNIADLSERLNQILNDKHNLEEVGKNGNSFINKKFCWDDIGRLTKKAYQNL